MKILGVGLSKTGTNSLHRALMMLGYKSIHYDRLRLTDILDGSNPKPDFRRYDDVDAVTDIPSAYFYRELLAAYPASKAILTVRDLDSWWKSMEYHSNTRYRLQPAAFWTRLAVRLGLERWYDPDDVAHDRFRAYLRNCVWGSTVATEFLYKKRFVEHNERVQAEVPADRLLVMNIIAGEGWDTLCPFLGVTAPSEPFPHAFKTNYEQRAG